MFELTFATDRFSFLSSPLQDSFLSNINVRHESELSHPEPFDKSFVNRPDAGPVNIFVNIFVTKTLHVCVERSRDNDVKNFVNFLFK